MTPETMVKRGSKRSAKGTTSGGSARVQKSGGEAKPTYSLPKPDTRVYLGDCRARLRDIPECRAGEVDLVFADPPFNWKRDYAEWHDSMPTDDYLAFTREWIDLCVRALKPDGSIWINIPDDWAAEIVVHLKGNKDFEGNERAPLHMVSWCIWHYRFGQNVSGRFINSKVHVLYFSKDAKKRTWNEEPILEPSDRATTYFDDRTYNKKEGKSGLRVPMDVWYGPNWGRIQGNNKERRANHDNQIPELYLERVIRATSNEGDLVLDPFLGSGTTCTVARELNRRSIGIEFGEGTAKSAFERIEKGPLRVKRATPNRTVTAIFSPRNVGEKRLKRIEKMKNGAKPK
ncbi:MAG TPA: site-specific DNA-methyltransferase [Phycisphaerales bacterium]|nr:site-specific DNA-methyltransferase [Phycisphaerales bacterium]